MIPNLSHSGLLLAIYSHAQSKPEKEALIIGERVITYSQLWTSILKAASFLKKQGINRGDNILLAAQKHENFIFLYFASQLIGAINVVADIEAGEDRINFIIETVKPKLTVGINSPSRVSFNPEDLQLEDYEPWQHEELDLSENDVAEILFTTGTTGTPKGVCLSHANIYGSASNINSYIGNTEEDREVLALPICHSFGLGRVRCNLLAGATIILLGNFGDVRRFFKAIEQHNASGFGMVPAAWAYIRKISGKRIAKYSDKIRYIEIGSASMSEETKRELAELFPNTRICMHYGLTEASRCAFIELHDSKHLNSAGRPVSDKVEISIFDSNGQEVPTGEIGEIGVRGNMVCERYFNESKGDSHFGDFVRTGDIGYLDTDGYLYLIGREKELINVGGKKVSPEEVENAVTSICGGDCVCIPMSDALMGERVKCLIKRNSTSMNFDEIEEALQASLHHYQMPAAFDWIDEIPTTSSGKKQRTKLR